MLLTTAIQRYLNHLQQKHYSKKTISEYQRSLELYLSFLTANNAKRVTHITDSLNNDFLKHRFYTLNQFGRQNTPATRNREIVALRSFLLFLFHQERLPSPLHDSLSYYKESSKRIPNDILNKRELIKLFTLPDTSTLTGYRDRMILELLYASAITRHELMTIQVNDVHFHDQTILIRQNKTAHQRIIPINRTALSYIRHYIDDVRPKLIKGYKTQQETKRLVLGTTKPIVHESTITASLKTYFKKANLKKNISAHSFRHTCATHLLQNGMPLRHLQEFLGHQKLDSTLRYLALHTKDLQREYKRFHPREQT